MTPKVTFLLSAFDRPHFLWASLGSLIAQSDPSWECKVLVNRQEMLTPHLQIVRVMCDKRISIAYSGDVSNHVWDCYWSAEWAFANLPVKGEWICCASDDSYYCPEFVERMTGVPPEIDLTFCDVLYDRRYGGRRQVLDSQPVEGGIDKTNFMVRRGKWIGFPDKRTPGGGGTNNADGKAVEDMARRGYKMRKILECLAVHN